MQLRHRNHSSYTLATIYKQLSPRWQQWDAVVTQCSRVALDLFDSAL